MAIQNNVIYKGVLATLGAIHIVGYTAVTGDTGPLMGAVSNIANSATNMTTTGTTIKREESTPSSMPICIDKASDFNQLNNATNAFILKNDINATGIESIHNFQGRLEGRGHTISGLTDCLFHNLKGEVRDIKFTNAKIITTNDTRTNNAFGVGVVACHLDKKGRLDDINVSRSTITVHGEAKVAGAIVGSSHGQLNHVHSVNNSILSTGETLAVGGIGGEIIQGSLSHGSVIDNNIVAINHDSHAGGVAGAIEGAAIVSHVHVSDAQIETLGRNSKAGGVAGMIMGNSQYTHVTNTTVFAGGPNSYAGGITGRIMPQSVVTDSRVTYSEIETKGNNSLAGGIAGLSRGNVIHASASNNTIISKGIASHAAGIIGHNTNYDELGDISEVILFEESDLTHQQEDVDDGDYDLWNFNDTDYGYEPDEYYTSLNAARQGNTKGILNLAVSESNNIRAEGTDAQAGSIVAVNDGLIFDSSSSNNNVTTNGVSENETINYQTQTQGATSKPTLITNGQTSSICDDKSAGLTNLQTAAIVAAGTVVLNSYYNGWKEGERGARLALRPLRSAVNGVVTALNFAKTAIASHHNTIEVEIAFTSVNVDEANEMKSTTDSTLTLCTNEH